jgi:hypothetical protein
MRKWLKADVGGILQALKDVNFDERSLPPIAPVADDEKDKK